MYRENDVMEQRKAERERRRERERKKERERGRKREGERGDGRERGEERPRQTRTSIATQCITRDEHGIEMKHAYGKGKGGGKDGRKQRQMIGCQEGWRKEKGVEDRRKALSISLK